MGLVLMRAVRGLPRPDLESLGRVFVRAVQRSTPEEPRAEAREFVEVAALLRGADGEEREPSWLVISSASAHLHHLNWLASNDQVVDLTGSLRAINGLVIPILIKFAKATGREGMWHELLERGTLLLEHVETTHFEDLFRQKRQQEYAHYNLAVACGHVGQRGAGPKHLAEAIALNHRRM